MRKENPARFSSAVGEAWMHYEFKVKYCHKIFDDEIYCEGLRVLLVEASYNYEIPTGELGFADDHLHFMSDIGNYSRPEVAKLLRDYVGKKFFEYFPEFKRPKWERGLFWNIGLLNPSYYIGSSKYLAHTINYIRNTEHLESNAEGKKHWVVLLLNRRVPVHAVRSMTGGRALATF